jgi:membrane carboxypeptidase/penicillin-binding protein PbpC
LSSAPRVKFDSNWEFLGKKRIAFKTGTSAHAKDMLSIGVTPKYTVAIWFGNFDRKFGADRFDRRKNGLKVASPVMLEVFDNLDDNSWFKRPKDILRREVCIEPIVVDRCKRVREDFVIKGLLLQTPCEILTPNLLIRLIEQGEIESLQSLKKHPCFKEWSSYKPLIEGLSNGKTYIKNRLLPKEMKKIALKCYSFDTNSTIFWLINDKEPIKWVSKKPLFIYLPPDDYTIRCIDMQSREAKVKFKLEEM